MQDDLDQNLHSLFEEKRQDLAEEPFLGYMLKLIEKRRFRRIFIRRLLLLLGFACCILLSPVLIKYSILLSGALNALFETAGNLCSTPTGMITTALCAVLILIFNRRLISRFV